MYNLFIDDQIDDWLEDIQDYIRSPKRIDPTREYVAVKSVQDAIDYVVANGCPSFISFDHDLGIVNGKDETTVEFVDWLIRKDMDSNFSFIPEGFSYRIHSANNQAKDRLSKLGQYISKRKDGFFN